MNGIAGDPITVEIIRNAFTAIATEMNANLARSAFSPVIYEMKDCSVALFNERAELLGQSTGLPIFLGGLDEALKATINHVGLANFEPGDIYILNDPYLTGSHLNDVVIESPIFWQAQLVGFTASKAHWRDIGGKNAGLITDSTEIYQEGLRLGPTRLVVAGEMRADILDIMTRNSRIPVALTGDLNAQIAAARTGERRLGEIIGRFGLDCVRQAIAEIFAQTERSERQIVAALPDGDYSAEGFLDNDGFGSDPVPVKVKVQVKENILKIDLTGSGPQTPGSLNCGLAQTLSATRLVFKFLVQPQSPPNGGSFKPLQVTVPPRSVFAAEEPAACLYYYPHLGLAIDLILQALAPIMPTVITSGQTADPMNIFFSGWNPRNKQHFMTGEATAIGWGAAASKDGENALANYGAGDLKNMPVEVVESKFPLRIERYSLNRDSGGAGRHRGGLGLMKDFVSLEENTALTLWFERSQLPAWGLFGGKSGSAPVVYISPATGTRQTAWKVNHLPIAKGTRVSVRTGGGGGFGSPWERDTRAVLDDLLDDYISQESAESDYGLRFQEPDNLLDETATDRARRRMAAGMA
jgi:N-methylhydantoinase B